MDDDSQEANEKFMRLMTVSAERMVSQDEPPYELGVRLMADLTSLFEADHAGGPTPCGDFSRTASTGHVHTRRGLSELQIEGLMRQAAREWLALSDPADDELTRCFKRWDDWPDSLGEEEPSAQTATSTCAGGASIRRVRDAPHLRRWLRERD